VADRIAAAGKAIMHGGGWGDDIRKAAGARQP
jgi:hypothetical protein